MGGPLTGSAIQVSSISLHSPNFHFGEYTSISLLGSSRRDRGTLCDVVHSIVTDRGIDVNGKHAGVGVRCCHKD